MLSFLEVVVKAAAPWTIVNFDNHIFHVSFPLPRRGRDRRVICCSCELGRAVACPRRLRVSGSLTIMDAQRDNDKVFLRVFLRSFLNFMAPSRFQIMTIAVNSSIPTNRGIAICQNLRTDIWGALPPNSFTVCMPKY